MSDLHCLHCGATTQRVRQEPQNRLSRANRCSVDLDYTDGIYGPQIGAQRIGDVA